MKRLLPLLILSALLASCSSDTIYEGSYSVDPKGWRVDSVGTFAFNIDDTTRLYNIDFVVRNTGDYNYQNLWLFVEFVRPNMVYNTDTVQLFLADDMGKWVGSGISSIYSADYAYKDSIRFSQKGQYLINIRQAMRDADTLKGIASVGVSVSYVKQ